MTIGKRLVGKIIMITGAAQGMGRQASIEFVTGCNCLRKRS